MNFSLHFPEHLLVS